MTVHEAVCPLLVVAVMTAVPGAIPLIFPFASTVATAVLLLAHVTVLKSVFFGVIVALSDADLPVFTVSAALDTLIAVGYIGVTVTVQLAITRLPSAAIQVITAVPPALPTTTPAPDTVATFLLLDVHFTFLLLAVAGATDGISFTFCVRAIVVLPRFSAIDATGCLTVIGFYTVVVFVLIRPFLSTVVDTTLVMIVTLPPLTNETVPLASTVATAGLLDEKVVD